MTLKRRDDMQKRKVGFLLATVALLIGFIMFQFPSSANAGCSWSVGRYNTSSGETKSYPLPSGQCTWYVDGKTDRNGWDLVFKVTSGRDAYKWYANSLISNAKQGTIGYPSDIMVFNKGKDSKGNDYSHGVGHVAFIVSRGYWNGKRAWTVRHANWSGVGQTKVDTVCDKPINQCTFVESSSGWVKILNGKSLGDTAYPLLGFLYKK